MHAPRPAAARREGVARGLTPPQVELYHHILQAARIQRFHGREVVLAAVSSREFVADASVELVGVEAGGAGVETGRHAASISAGLVIPESNRSSGRKAEAEIVLPEPVAMAPERPNREEHRLNPGFTFTNFVNGKANQIARAAAVQVAENPGTAYNPLYIYGGVGLGKTHLMQAIGHTIKKNNPAMRLTYISAEKFTNEVINSLRYDKMVSFRDKYRNVDVLLIDDIEFIAGKERTQEEFFHTFNALYEAHKQIVLSSDRFPKDMPDIEERLRSRFEWGLIADLQPPDVETRIAILRKKSEDEGVKLPEDVIQFLSNTMKSIATM